jgi:hypothetical protein
MVVPTDWWQLPADARSKYRQFIKGVCITYPASQVMRLSYAQELLQPGSWLNAGMSVDMHVRAALSQHCLALHHLVKEHGWQTVPAELKPLIQRIAKRAVKVAGGGAGGGVQVGLLRVGGCVVGVAAASGSRRTHILPTWPVGLQSF